MRIKVGPWAIGLFTLLAACGSADRASEAVSAMDVTEAAADASASGGEGAQTDAAKGEGAAPVAVAVPRIAYIYKLGYRLPGADIPELQQAHVALCDKLGASRCQVARMQSAGGEADYASGTLKLRVASAIARQFTGQLTAAAQARGGRGVDSAIEAEDVSKQIVDASARIRQRELLVARLTEILRTRQGSVGDLVAAERAVAQAQEELDQAKGWLAELNGRVAFSTVEIGYGAQAADSGGFGAQLSDTFAESGSLFVIGLRALLTILIVLAPWALVFGPLVWLGLRWRRRRAARAAAAEPS